jgi:hypothetical protein
MTEFMEKNKYVDNDDVHKQTNENIMQQYQCYRLGSLEEEKQWSVV